MHIPIEGPQLTEVKLSPNIRYTVKDKKSFEFRSVERPSHDYKTGGKQYAVCLKKNGRSV